VKKLYDIVKIYDPPNYYSWTIYVIYFEKASLDTSNEMMPDKLVSGSTIDTLIKTSMLGRDWQWTHAQIQSFEYNIALLFLFCSSRLTYLILRRPFLVFFINPFFNLFLKNILHRLIKKYIKSD